MTRNSSRVRRRDPNESTPELQLAAGPREQLLADLPVSERHLELNGVSTAVLEGGEGSPIVLLHGPGEYAAKWLRVIPELVADHRVIAPDLPGHGTSAPIAGGFGTERILDWLEELIQQTCSKPPVLVGQILGGAIAARFASERGQHLGGLVLVDALGLTEFQPTPEFGMALTQFLSAPSEATHDELWKRCAYDLDALRGRLGERWDSIKAYNIDRARAGDLHSTQQRLMELFGFPAISPDELERITVPTTLIWGRHDLATALSVAEETSADFGWPLIVIEMSADDPPVEQPEAFLRALRTALSG